MAKQVSFSREKVLKGFNQAADAVVGTIGPKGKNVFLMDTYTPVITNDGVTIANKIVLEDPEEDAGAYVIRNITGQQNDDVGDGTTTVATLLQSIINESLKRPENAMEVSLSLKEAGDKVLKILAKKSIKITKKDIEKVALISAENKDLAKIITEVFDKLGEKAVINVEDSKTFATEYEIVDGYEAHVGFISPHFITDKKTAKAEYSDIPVFVTEKKISNISDIKPLWEQFAKAGISQCVIVCDDIDDSMLGMFVTNNAMGTFKSLIIKATGPLLQDIEAVVGATMVSDTNGVRFQDVKLEHLGKAKKVISTANKTLFLGDGESAKKHATHLEKASEFDPNQYAAKKLIERVSKLRGGVASLRIGAPTDFEREYLKFKAEDAVKAVKAALEEGVVEGGGMALWRIAQDLDTKTIGEQILSKALKAPLIKIIENCGKDYADIIKELPEGKGYDAKSDKYVDMVESGIIDPAKVERCAVENAISSASQFITSFCFITDIHEKDK